ncbi:MAG: tRNA lysidine(34) synthetase TilS, partial [Candidatus Subteraquimicrobiales bacterium]|nr:tRNA lysidine(34) synthetase TilS [Candidatus Subteraquimicrobiales bacterium]
MALGHHSDDSVETFLMRVLQGAGMEGLRGILPVRERYIRPLIEIERREIRDFCQRNNLEFRRDASNFSLSIKRNKIRYHLVPLLKDYNPEFKGTLLNTIEILTAEHAYLDEIAEKELAGLKETGKGFLRLTLSKLTSLPLTVQRRVIRKAIEFVKGDLRGIEFKHIDEILKKAVYEKESFQIDLPSDLVTFCEHDEVVVAKKDYLKKPPPLFECVLETPGTTKVKELGVEFKTDFVKKEDFAIESRKQEFDGLVAFLDAERLRFPLKVRTRRLGDSFRPLGMEGKKKLQDFFVDEKVAKRKRDWVPLVLSGARIIWVAGYRIDDDFKVVLGTKRILKI